MIFDLISSEYGWTDEYILDRTIDRVTQCVDKINARLNREFRTRAKLMEAAVRNIAVFSAQTREGANAAANITLLPDDKPEHPMEQSRPDERSQVILPAGVDPERTRPSKPSPVETHTTIKEGAIRFEADDADLPDDATRKITPDKPEEAMNKTGSFNKLLRMLGGAPGGDSLSPGQE